jgi:hypothetical protein
MVYPATNDTERLIAQFDAPEHQVLKGKGIFTVVVIVSLYIRSHSLNALSLVRLEKKGKKSHYSVSSDLSIS